MNKNRARETGPDIVTDLGLLSLAFIWGLNFPVLKSALNELSPLALNALRFPLASLVVFFFLYRLEGVRLPDREDWPRLIFLGILGNVIYQLFFIFGVDLTLAGNASILLSTVPVWTLLLSLLARHEKAAANLIVGVLGTLAGMALVVLGGSEELAVAGQSLTGDLLIVGAAVAWSFYTVGSQRPLQKYGSLTVTAWTLWIGTVGVVIVGIPNLLETDFSQVSARSWGGVTYAGALAIGVAYVLWYRGVHRIGNSKTAVYSNLVPVVALLGAWIWLGEQPTLLQLLGAGVIIGCLTLTRLKNPFGRDALGGSRWKWRME